MPTIVTTALAEGVYFQRYRSPLVYRIAMYSYLRDDRRIIEAKYALYTSFHRIQGALKLAQEM